MTFSNGAGALLLVLQLLGWAEEKRVDHGVEESPLKAEERIRETERRRSEESAGPVRGIERLEGETKSADPKGGVHADPRRTLQSHTPGGNSLARQGVALRYLKSLTERLLRGGDRREARPPRGVLGDEMLDGEHVVFYYEGRDQVEAVSEARMVRPLWPKFSVPEVTSPLGHPSTREPASWTARYSAELRRRLSEFSTRAVSGFSVVRHNDGTATLVFAHRSVEISAKDCTKILKGQQPGNAEVHQLFGDPEVTYVYVANVLSEDYRSPTGRLADKLVRLALDAHPTARVVRDPMNKETLQRIESVAQFDDGAALKVRAIIPDEGQGVVDGKLLQNLREDLEAQGVKIDTTSSGDVMAGAEDEESESTKPLQTLIVISGHSSKQLARFIDHAGTAKFKDAIVFFESCGTPLTRSLVDRMLRTYGATSVFAFDGKITVNQLEPATLDLAKELRPAPDRPANRRLLRIKEMLRTHGLRAVPFVDRGPDVRFRATPPRRLSSTSV